MSAAEAAWDEIGCPCPPTAYRRGRLPIMMVVAIRSKKGRRGYASRMVRTAKKLRAVGGSAMVCGSGRSWARARSTMDGPDRWYRQSEWRHHCCRGKRGGKLISSGVRPRSQRRSRQSRKIVIDGTSLTSPRAKRSDFVCRAPAGQMIVAEGPPVWTVWALVSPGEHVVRDGLGARR